MRAAPLGRRLFTRPISNAGAPAPTPANYNFAAIGDSRTLATLSNSDIPANFGLSMGSAAKGVGAWAELLTGGRMVAIPHRPIDFGIGSQTTNNILTIPRATDATKGLNYLARSPAGIVLALLGTNDSASLLGAADPGFGSGALSTTSSKSNIRYMIEYLTDATRNAAINAGLGIEGSASNLYGGVGKTVILINELPPGRMIANGGTVTLNDPNSEDHAAMYAFSRWLLTLDYTQAGGYPNVIVVNGYDALADYTTIPDAAPSRPAGKPAFGGGSTANADTYLPDPGAYVDGLHPTAYGGLKIGQALATTINAAWSAVTAYLDAAHPVSGTTQYVTLNPRLTGTGGTNSGFHSVTGSVPASMTVDGTNCGDIDLTISSRTDTDGETAWRFQGSGTSTTTGVKYIFLGLPATSPSGWATGVNGPAVAHGDKLRLFSNVRILGANKLLEIAAVVEADDSASDADLNTFATGATGASASNRTYLHDTLASVDSGLSAFTPIVSRVLDTSNQVANATAGFGNLVKCFLQISFHANATDAPIGTTISFDFEVKGLGLRKITDPGYNATNQALDFFTDTDATLLTAHTATAGTWTKATGYTVDGAITSNRVRSNAAGLTALQNSTDPGADNYRVWSKMRRVTGVGATGIVARVQSGAATFYSAVYDAAGGNLVLSRYVAGVETVLLTTAMSVADATSFYLSLEVETINSLIVQLRVWKDGVQVGADYIDSTGSRITTRGKAGILLNGSTATTGVHVDALTAMQL